MADKTFQCDWRLATPPKLPRVDRTYTEAYCQPQAEQPADTTFSSFPTTHSLLPDTSLKMSEYIGYATTQHRTHNGC